jgi:hypothetical protein
LLPTSENESTGIDQGRTLRLEPSAASTRAVASPIPDEAPVMTATRWAVDFVFMERLLGSSWLSLTVPADATL